MPKTAPPRYSEIDPFSGERYSTLGYQDDISLLVPVAMSTVDAHVCAGMAADGFVIARRLKCADVSQGAWKDVFYCSLDVPDDVIMLADDLRCNFGVLFRQLPGRTSIHHSLNVTERHYLGGKHVFPSFGMVHLRHTAALTSGFYASLEGALNFRPVTHPGSSNSGGRISPGMVYLGVGDSPHVCVMELEPAGDGDLAFDLPEIGRVRAVMMPRDLESALLLTRHFLPKEYKNNFDRTLEVVRGLGEKV